MKKLLWPLFLVLTLSLLLAGCSGGTNQQAAPTPPAEKKEIIVSAAASLKNSLDEIEKNYEAANAGINLTITYGASGTLQKQIEQGAPADLFISAGKSQMDALEKGNLLAAGTRKDLLGNALVLVTGKDNTKIKSFQDLAKAGKVSIGTPESVPAGKYAQEALTKMKLWDSIPKDNIVYAKDVTQVLTYAETGNVEAGIVYKSDAAGSDKVKVVATAPADSHSPIVYPAAVIAASKNQDEAKAFLAYLSSAPAKAVFEKYGFLTDI